MTQTQPAQKPPSLAFKAFVAVAALSVATGLTVFAWNYALLGMFTNLPELKAGNVFLIYAVAYLIKIMFTSPFMFSIHERLEIIDSNMKIIHHNDTAQRKDIVEILKHLDSNIRLAHGNDLEQRKAITEILSIINNKLDGEKTVVDYNEVE
jgi:hypothetical protein